jgi:hypothetical protein
MEVLSAQPYAPAVLSAMKDTTGIHWKVSLVRTRTGMDVVWSRPLRSHYAD